MFDWLNAVLTPETINIVLIIAGLWLLCVIPCTVTQAVGIGFAACALGLVATYVARSAMAIDDAAVLGLATADFVLVLGQLAQDYARPDQADIRRLVAEELGRQRREAAEDQR